MKKIIGYILAIIGLVAIALTFPQVSQVLNLGLPESIDSNFLFIGGIILVVIGILISLRGTKTKQRELEVPIYQSGRVVGYRRN